MTAGTPTATVVDLDDPRATRREDAGGKAATLARLRQAGIRVPPGFVVTTAACTHVLDASPAAGDADVALPDDLRRTIGDALVALGAERVAVRSSAVAEDETEASFAGQYETILGAAGRDDVLAAVGAVLASARSARVVAYRASRGGDDPGVAVLVQRLVPADAAGVAFSANPVTGARDETLVSAVRGVGDRLVSGAATPDEFVVRDGAVEALDRPERAIDTARARDVAALAERLEELLGRPQDVEWALAGERLHVLQSRPITALPVPPEVDLPSGTWAKDTSHYPELLTPLGESVYLDALDDAVATMCREWGLLVDRVEQRSISGEVYVRPVPLGGKEGGPAPPWWVVAVLARVVPPLRRRMRAATRRVEAGALDAAPRRWEDDWRPELRRRVEELRSVDLAALGDDALRVHLDRVVDLMRRGQRVHFHLFIPYAVGVHELARLAEDLIGWSVGDTMQLLQGLSAASSEPARAMRGLADLVRTRPAARSAVAQEGNGLLDRLEQIAPELADAVRTYRDEWGLRAVNYDPGSPTLLERPALLARLLRDAVEEAERSPEDNLRRAREEARARARREFDAEGVSDADRRRFEQALDYAERVYPVREDNVFWADNAPNALLRLAALEVGRRLAERGVLTSPEDAVWLDIDELHETLDGDAPRDDLHGRIERRKGERRWVRANPGPPVIGPEPSPPPDVRGLPEAARRTNAALLWLMGLEGYDAAHRDKADAADLAGVGASAGRHTGTVRVVTGEHEFERLRPGDVLVCPTTTPAWSVLFGHVGAVVADGGGVLSHPAIVAREHGIPAVLGTGDATSRLRDGMTVTVDGSNGTITIEKDTT